jgi:hypothetical protein
MRTHAIRILVVGMCALGCNASPSVRRAASAPSPRADDCPSDVVDPFVGQWTGSALLVRADGRNVPQPKTVDQFARTDCDAFSVEIQYFDEMDKPTRLIQFSATADPNDPSTFIIAGLVYEGAADPKPMDGAVRAVEPGTFLATFQTALDNKDAYFTELINVAPTADGRSQTLTRTIQMFAGGKGGPYLGSRVALEAPVPPPPPTEP